MDSEARVSSLMGGALKGPNGLTRVPHDEGLAPPSAAVPVPLGGPAGNGHRRQKEGRLSPQDVSEARTAKARD